MILQLNPWKICRRCGLEFVPGTVLNGFCGICNSGMSPVTVKVELLEDRSGYRPEHHPANVCPKFHVCAAPICPLDEDWKEQVMHETERLCRWLSEAGKINGLQRIKPYLPLSVYEKIEIGYRVVKHSAGANPTLRRRLKIAWGLSSKIAAGERLTALRSPSTSPPTA